MTAASREIPTAAAVPSADWLTAQERALQARLLNTVSRTFALTIPRLPGPLADIVGHAYLLCRIADTVEDDPDLTPARKRYYLSQFNAVLNGTESPRRFADSLGQELSPAVSAGERELIARTPDIIGAFFRLNQTRQGILRRCVRVMSEGMQHFQGTQGQSGLADLHCLRQYCYCVAGIVGETLTELFCDYSPAIAKHRDAMLALSRSFGNGLQMTNILKDLWDDRRRGVCWLPQDLFARRPGPDPTPDGTVDLLGNTRRQDFETGLVRLIGVTRGHLRDALRYTLLIPRQEAGIRHFCLWALSLAVLTLRNINRHRHFRTGDEVKVSRASVKATIALSTLSVRNDWLLKAIFGLANVGLPAVPSSAQAGNY